MSGYRALHNWVERKRPLTGTCQKCGRTGCRTENANLSGEYRRDLDDFLELCSPCHKNMHLGRPVPSREFVERLCSEHASLPRPGRGTRVSRGALVALAAKHGLDVEYARAIIRGKVARYALGEGHE